MPRITIDISTQEDAYAVSQAATHAMLNLQAITNESRQLLAQLALYAARASGEVAGNASDSQGVDWASRRAERIRAAAALMQLEIEG